MKISNQQVIILVDTLRDTLKLHDGAGIFGFTYKTREKLYQDIMHQQSCRIVDLSEDNVEEGE